MSVGANSGAQNAAVGAKELDVNNAEQAGHYILNWNVALQLSTELTPDWHSKAMPYMSLKGIYPTSNSMFRSAIHRKTALGGV